MSASYFQITIQVNNGQHIVYGTQILADQAKERTVGYLQVHVGIDRDQESLVLLSPLQLDQDCLSCEIVEEWLRVDGYELR